MISDSFGRYPVETTHDHETAGWAGRVGQLASSMIAAAISSSWRSAP